VAIPKLPVATAGEVCSGLGSCRMLIPQYLMPHQIGWNPGVCSCEVSSCEAISVIQDIIPWY
jgi:hypothetical protein